jgi:hypothetical protein
MFDDHDRILVKLIQTPDPTALIAITSPLEASDINNRSLPGRRW